MDPKFTELTKIFGQRGVLEADYSFGSNVVAAVERQILAQESGGGSTTEFQIGDKVILNDFSHEVYGNNDRPSSWHWISEFDELVGQTFTIRKITPAKVARLDEVKTTAGFPFHWLIKVYELPEELFEI